MSNIEGFKGNSSQLMMQEERTEYHAEMQATKTAEEQEQIRKEHHQRMKEQAKTRRSVILPNAPPARGGRGMGSGSGGMGHGGGRNR
jgi:uncharacterized membrane protein